MIIDGTQFCTYGDQVYVLRPWIQTAYPLTTAAAEQVEFNKSMNSARTSLQWSYKDIKQDFVSHDFYRKLQVERVPVAHMYISCALLRNFKTCLGYNAQPSHYFGCSPPSLEEYLEQ